MEETSTALDCPLILFYINMKHLLKTKQLSEKLFLEQMVKHCKDIGFHNYSSKEIKNIWKKLIAKYVDLKMKGTIEDKENWKYFEILDSCFEQSDFHRDKRVKFSEEVISLLIENFTNKKINCVIQGYENDQVLSEIQTACKNLGFYLSKQDIKQQWKCLTNIYKFLIDRGKTSNTWIHFEAMKNHYQDNFWNGVKSTKENAVQDKPRCLRPRSKSVGCELKRKSWDSQEKSYSVITTEKRRGRKPLNRKAKNKRYSQESELNEIDKKIKLKENKEIKKPKSTEKNEELEKINNFSTAQMETTRMCTNITPTSKIHVINIDHSDICQKSGNFTINLPSITKQFSDNEYLPLKKRLRMEGDGDNNSSMPSEIGGEYLGFFTSNTEDIQQFMNDANHLNENILRRDSVQYQKMSNEQNQENVSLFEYRDPNDMEKPPIVLIIKVDDGGNPIKDCESIDTAASNYSSGNHCESNDKTQKITSGSSQDTTTPDKFAISTERRHKSIIRTENSNHILSTEVPDAEMDIIYSEISDSHTNNISTKENEQNGNVISSSDNEQTENIEFTKINPFTASNISTFDDKTTYKNVENSEQTFESGEFSSLCSFTGSISSPDEQKKHKNTENENTEPNDFIFRKPLAVNQKPHSVEKQPSGNNKCRLPVKVGGKLKEIFISPSDLSKINKLKPNSNCPQLSDKSTAKTNPSINSTASGIKYLSQVIKPASVKTSLQKQPDEVLNSTVDNPALTAQSDESDFNLLGNQKVSGVSNQAVEEFENESVISEAVGDTDLLKDNLLATVIDFQEQNNQEFIEIKNLMKQNNLLQRETNRLLRLILEKS